MKNNTVSETGVGRVGRLNSGSVAGFAIASETSGAGYVIQERRSQLKLYTVDDVLFLHSNLKHHFKHQIV